MKDMNSALYSGTVLHHRHAPKRHKLSYRVFSLLLDLDELPGLTKRLRLFSVEGWNLFSFRHKDHGRGDGGCLKEYAIETCRQAGATDPIKRVELLFYPRLWGYSFNPLAVYFCYDESDALAAIIYEVTNTFGERHSYVLPAPGEGNLRHQCDKEFYVSPFLPMEGRYHFHIRPPAEKVVLGIQQKSSNGAALNAVFVGEREELSDLTLMKALLSNPAMTAKVIVGIHWEALKLWRKGIPFHQRPAPPVQPFTVIQSEKSLGKSS